MEVVINRVIARIKVKNDLLAVMGVRER